MIRRPATILALLTALNLLNYLDRLVLSAVLPKVRDELALSRFEGGLLATVFLLGYFVTSPVFGALGDRLARKGLIALGILVWSVATLGSGMATGLGSLIAARAVVGVGEASYATLAPTIIDDITPPQKKGRALGIFYVATPIGAALGYLVGGFVEHRWGWRHAFYVAGGPGIALAVVCLFIKEPARTISKEKPNVLRDLGALVRLPLYRYGVLGYCAYTAAVGAFSYWAPEFLYRRYHLDLDVANFRFGIIVIVAGAIATWIGGRWADMMRARVEKEAPPAEVERETIRGLLRICAIGSVLGTPLAAAAFLSPSPTLFFAFSFFCILALFMSTSPINAVVLKAVPEELRASAMALCIFGIHLLGDLWSPPLVGLLADHLPVEIAMMSLPVAIAASAWLWWPAGATGRRAAAA
jgi:MFS family permease